MDNCVFYCRERGSDWYMCTDCGYKHRGHFLVCPVCKNEQPNEEIKQAVRQATAAMIAGRLKK